VRRRFSPRLGFAAVLVALAALVVSPAASTANFTIVPDGAAVRVSVNTSGGTSTATFNGTAGQRVSLNINNVTITSSKVSLLKPNGNNTLTPFTVTRTGYFMDVVTLPASGTYKFLIDPKDTYTGHMDLQLFLVPPDPTSAITAGGAAVPATTTKPGQNALFTFSGLAGHRMAVEVTDVTLTGGSAKVRILKPDGTALGTAATFNNGGGFLEPKALPANGNYTVQADPRFLATGTFSVRLHDVPADASAALTVDGAAVQVSTTTPGQNAAFMFTATAGTRYSVKLTESSFNSAKVTWLKPDGTALFSPSLAISPLGTFLAPRSLSPAGTYKVFVDPALAETGSLKAQVFTVPADLSGSIAFGTPLNVAIAKPGQNAAYTFTGVKDRRVSLNLTNNSYDGVAISILQPDGTKLFSPALTVTGPGAFRDPIKLPVGGTYKVKVDPVDAATGAIDVTLYDVTADATGTITANGTPTSISLNPGQNGKLTFSTSTANQRVALRVSKGAVSSLKVSLDKSGTTTHYFYPTSINSDPQFLDTESLGPAGGYQIVLDPQGASAGSITVTLYTVPADVTGPVSSGSNSVTLSLGQNARLTFSGTAGQTVTVNFSSGNVAQAWAKVLRPDGTQLESAFWDPSLSSNPPVTDTLPVNGTYTFLLDPVADKSGSTTFTFSLS
jgi:hypothetical protein